jgi:hypothetical protein
VGLFLLFLYYVALSSRGDPGLDFAGWNGVATAGMRLSDLSATVVLLAAAMPRHRMVKEGSDLMAGAKGEEAGAAGDIAVIHKRAVSWLR